MEENFKSRFEQAFSDTHKEDIPFFLEEFQYSYLVWIMQDDNAGYERWRRLISSLYSAGDFSIRKNPDLFLKIVDIMLNQFDYLNDEMFSKDSFVVEQSNHFSKDLIDAGIDGLAEKGKLFENYMKKRIEVNKKK